MFSATAQTAYTFGIGRTVGNNNTLNDGQEVIKGAKPDNVTITQSTTCDFALTSQTLYHGSKDASDTYIAPKAWRNMLRGGTAVNAAFNEGFYAGFKVTIPDGYKMNVSQIFGDFLGQKNNFSYKFEVFSLKDETGTILYTSGEHAAANIQSCGTKNVAMSDDVSKIAALQNLTGTVEFRMPWRIASSAAAGAVLDFNITATIVSDNRPTFIFNENSVKKSDIAAAKDQTSDVTIQRTFLKDGSDYTICLPFSLDAEALADSPLAGYSKLQEFSSATVKNKGADNQTVALTMTDATEIVAGKPYIISWASGDNIINPVFCNVTVTLDTPVEPTVESNGVKFWGVLAPKSVTANDKTIMFIDSDGTLKWPSVVGNIKGFRCYFTVE